MRVQTQEGEGLIVPGTERHEHLFEVRTRMYARDNYVWFSSRERECFDRFAHLLNY